VKRGSPSHAPIRFDTVLTALEQGWWLPHLQVVPARPDGSEQLARLATLLSEIAKSQRDQVLGDVEAARVRLERVAAGLPTHLRQQDDHGRFLAVAPLARPSSDDWPAWIARTARLVFREQAGLAELEDRARPGRCLPAHILVVAFVEHCRWVEFDGQLFRGRPVRGVPYAVGPKALCERATHLCRLADPRSADVIGSAWVTAGRYPGVRSAALQWLAAHPLVPPEGRPGHVPSAVPVRRARRAAHRLATEMVEDLLAS
jgi:hypothetical protein